MKNELVRRVFVLSFLVSASAVVYFGWTGGWAVSAQAGGMMASDGGPKVMTVQFPEPAQNKTFFERVGSSARNAKAYYNRGTAYYQKGNYASAIRYLSMALALEPNAPDVYFNRGLSYRRQRLNDQALSDFSSAIALNQTQSAYYFERCNVLIVGNDLDQALADCSTGLVISPEDADGYFLRGVAHILRGDVEAALEDSIQALQILPDHAGARRLLYEALVKRESMISVHGPSNPHNPSFAAAPKEM